MFPSGVRSAIKLLAGLGKTALEALDAATGIDQLLLAGVERMALAANFNMDLRLGVTGVDHVAAGASDGAVHIVRMDALLHGYFTSFSIMIQGAILDICAHHNLRIAATSARHPVRTEQPSERLLKYYNEVPRICQGFFSRTSPRRWILLSLFVRGRAWKTGTQKAFRRLARCIFFAVCVFAVP